MNEWKKVKLGELYEVHNGLSKGRQFFGAGFPFLTFSNVFNNWFLPKQLESLVQTTDKERESCSIKAGDVFITRTSETMDELGMSSVALRDYPNATYNGFTKRLRPITDRVNPRYIGYYLRTPKFRGQFMAFSSMTTRASLANNDLLNMEVELPPMEIQHRIASILSRYDSLIENYQKQIKLHEEAAQRLYKEWFVDLRFPGHENTKIVDGVPEGWEEKSISEVFDFKYGKILPTKDFVEDGPIPVYGASKQIGRYTKANCFEPKVLIGSRGNAGFVHRTIEDETYVTNNSFIVEPCAKYGYLKLPFIFESFKVLDFVAICTGAAQPQLTLNSISSLKYIVPIKDLIVRYCGITTCYFSKIALAYKQIHLLTEARDRLLPKLMSGEIEV
ncbi:restriction endonuclease subunit S [Phocaeicola sp. Sa1CVN1]|uniref:Restriction endonuclease subunit S n=1 Tax=Phocaeicola intestinalis TaxID=2762212 RepID=A0ABR8Y5I1_9BACT|nr:restriction endonuclease subunit S [Phocaeicola intestinalis]MBD8039460.1 restriction endonuclease subunit S [Phocaeicola intestinalis]